MDGIRCRWVTLAVVSWCIGSEFIFSQTLEQIDPLVKFGMEVVETPLGVKIVELDSSRPIAQKLKEGDVLVSYIYDRDGTITMKRIVEMDSVDELKVTIRNDIKVTVTVLRPRQDMTSFESFEVVIDVLDLMRPTVVDTRTVTRPIELSLPQFKIPSSATYSSIVENEEACMSVKVHYATDRILTPNNQYSGDRDLATQQPIKFGTCQVSIPPNHRRGQLESPSMWDFYESNPKKHVVLANVSQVGEAKTFESIKQILESSAVSKKSVLFFVHGYNVSFDDAARRSAQLHFDLNYPGASMFFSWPSNATASGYVSDAEDILWSSKHIEATLEKLCDQQEIEQIHAIAHSMGNRGLTSAIISLAQKGKTGKISEVILAAADLDAETFKRDIALKITSAIARTTVYASSKDKALWGSYALSGNPRVGEIRNGFPTIRPMEKLDIIDASNVETDLVSHSYYGNTSLIGDLYTLLGSGDPPPRQMLTERPAQNRKVLAIQAVTVHGSPLLTII